MTYSTEENSANSGRPVELYRFAVGVVEHLFTSADADFPIGLETYTATIISRDQLDFTSELNRSGLKIQTPRNSIIAELFRVVPPDQVVSVTILRVHLGAPADTIVSWSGRILSVEWSGSSASLYCEPVTTSLKRMGLRRRYTRGCPHLLYDTACRVNDLAYEVTGSIVSATATQVELTEADGFADGYFSGGYMTWVDGDGNLSTRTIETHVGPDLTMLTTAYGLGTGTPVAIYPGCNRTLALCESRFSDYLNYGGFPWIPTNNPFGGEIF